MEKRKIRHNIFFYMAFLLSVCLNLILITASVPIPYFIQDSKIHFLERWTNLIPLIGWEGKLYFEVVFFLAWIWIVALSMSIIYPFLMRIIGKLGDDHG